MNTRVRTYLRERREIRRTAKERKATFKRLARELTMYRIVYEACMGEEG